MGARHTTPPIDYQKIVYYAAPKSAKDGPKSLADVDPELLAMYEKLGVPLKEREILAGVAVDAVIDSVSVATTFREKLAAVGIIFCSFSEAVHEHPDLVRKYLGSVVPYTRQLLRGAELGGLLGRVVLLHPEGRPLPDGALDVLPDQPGRHGPVRADAHRRRGGGVRLRTSRAARRRSATRTSSTRPSSSSSRSTTPRSSTRPSRTGIPGDKRGQGRHLQLRHEARQVRSGSARRSPGRRSRPARRSRGSTRAASCWATTRSASSTRSRSRTTTSRPTRARR